MISSKTRFTLLRKQSHRNAELGECVTLNATLSRSFCLLYYWHHSFDSKPLNSFLDRIHDCFSFHSSKILYSLSLISVRSHSRSRGISPTNSTATILQWLTKQLRHLRLFSIAIFKTELEKNVFHFRPLRIYF